MAIEEKILSVSKEIVVKFIEVGRISPSSFGEVFKEIYQAVKEAVGPDESSEKKSTPKK